MSFLLFNTDFFYGFIRCPWCFVVFPRVNTPFFLSNLLFIHIVRGVLIHDHVKQINRGNIPMEQEHILHLFSFASGVLMAFCLDPKTSHAGMLWLADETSENPLRNWVLLLSTSLASLQVNLNKQDTGSGWHMSAKAFRLGVWSDSGSLVVEPVLYSCDHPVSWF